MPFYSLFIGILFSLGVASQWNCTAYGATFVHSAYDELNADQKQTVQRGEIVWVAQEIPSAPWPKVTLYQRVEATPEETMAVITDYELRPKYMGGLKRAKISGKADPKTVYVDYVLSLPVIGEESFSLEHKISSAVLGENYSSEWRLVRADRFKRSEGIARIERLGGATLLVFTHFLDPGIRMAGFLVSKEKFIKLSIEIIQTFVGQVQSEKSKAPEFLNQQIQALESALGW